MKKKGFSALPLVAMGVFDSSQYTVAGYTGDATSFERQWKADATVVVKRFKRNVRAGGASREVVAFVVRRVRRKVQVEQA